MECLLKFFIHPSYAGNNLRSDKSVFIKFDAEEFYENENRCFSFFRKRA
jgi:hypothetical protein